LEVSLKHAIRVAMEFKKEHDFEEDYHQLKIVWREIVVKFKKKCDLRKIIISCR